MQLEKLNGIEIRYDKTIEELIEIIKEKPPICWTGYVALAHHDSDESIKTLSNLLSSKDWTHTRSAIEAIGQNVRGLQIESELISFLDHSHQFIVTAAILTLSRLKSKNSHDKIKALIYSKNTEIRKTAINGLSNIWEIDDFKFLITLYNAEIDDSTRKAIGFVLADHVDESNWKLFFDVMQKDDVARHRYWAITFANQFSDEKAYFESFLNDPDGHICRKAKLFMEK